MHKLNTRSESVRRQAGDGIERLQDERRQGRVAVLAWRAEDLLQKTCRIHLRSAREVEDLEYGIAVGERRSVGVRSRPKRATHASIRLVSTTFPFWTAKLIPLRKITLVMATPIRVALIRSGTES